MSTSCDSELVAASSTVSGWPASTVNTVPSAGVGACQRRVRFGPARRSRSGSDRERRAP